MSETRDLQCPRCKQHNVDVLVTAVPQCYRCRSCGHTWDQPYLRPARDRRNPQQKP